MNIKSYTFCTIAAHGTRFNRSILVFLISFAFTLCPQSANADNGPDAGAQWWQFMSSLPASDNPLFDATGEKCSIGQRGDVWFIGGVMGAYSPDGKTFLGGGGTATRNCTVPKGKTLFFPVINSAQFDTPNICGQDSNHLTYDDLVGINKPFVDAAHDMVVTLNGRRISGLKRIASAPFEVTLPEANMWDQLCNFYGLGPNPAGIYAPAYQDGYYMTVPLPRSGNYILRIRGASGPFSLDVTYNLDVVPVNIR